MFKFIKRFVASITLVTIAASINVYAGQGSGGGGGGGGGSTPPPPNRADDSSHARSPTDRSQRA